MGMKYTITESTLRSAVRKAILRSGPNRWALNEGFISMFFNALGDAFRDMSQQYSIDQKREIEAKFTLFRKNLLSAIEADLKAKGVDTRRGGTEDTQFSAFSGFSRYKWEDNDSNDSILHVLTQRMNMSVPKATGLIARVAALPAIPGISKDGSSPAVETKKEDTQVDSIKSEAESQNAVIKEAGGAVTMPFADIALLFDGTPTYSKMEALIKDAGFGYTPVDFLHKVFNINTIVQEANYGAATFTPEVTALVKKACTDLSRAAGAGLENYRKQGNYQDTGTYALPSESVTGKQAKAGSESEASEK